MGNQPWPQFQNGIRERSIDSSEVKEKQEAPRRAAHSPKK